MISVVIDAGEGAEQRLARTLASLVPATVEGLVREGIVVGDGLVARVADHAGCHVAGSLGEAVNVARCDWLLLLEPGARLAAGWGEAVAAHLADGARPARFEWAGTAKPTLLQRLRPRPLACGLLIAKAEARRLLSGNRGHLPRRLRLARLAAGIVPAG